MTQIQSICVFCGSSMGNDEVFVATARHLGEVIACAGINLVFGGGNKGLMGAVADGALSQGGQVIGVIPEFLRNLEHAHENLTEMHVVDSMHQRKQLMFNLSDAFVVLPGGVGTLDEVLEMITWKQLKIHEKPIIVVDTNGYWEPLDRLIASTIGHGFATPATRHLYKLVRSVGEVITALKGQLGSAAYTNSSQL